MFTDTHVHLNSPQFRDDLEEVVRRAEQHGVTRFLVPGYDLESSRLALRLSQNHDSMAASVGIHPHDARTYNDEIESEFEAALAGGQALAAGEMGLDYYYDHSPRDVQRQVFRRQLRLAARHAVPVVVHNRDSDADMEEILEDEAGGLRLVLHAFTGSQTLIDLGVRAGFFFGIGGFLTFKNHPLAGVVGQLPLTSILLETDAPYLSPHPHRGKRNEPARVAVIATRLAEILQMSREEVALQTQANYQRFLTGFSPQ